MCRLYPSSCKKTHCVKKLFTFLVRSVPDSFLEPESSLLSSWSVSKFNWNKNKLSFASDCLYLVKAKKIKIIFFFFAWNHCASPASLCHDYFFYGASSFGGLSEKMETYTGCFLTGPPSFQCQIEKEKLWLFISFWH